MQGRILVDYVSTLSKGESESAPHALLVSEVEVIVSCTASEIRYPN